MNVRGTTVFTFMIWRVHKREPRIRSTFVAEPGFVIYEFGHYFSERVILFLSEIRIPLLLPAASIIVSTKNPLSFFLCSSFSIYANETSGI
jgi:hypothetical protein